MWKRVNLVFGLLLVACVPLRADDVHMLMGNPSQANENVAEKDNFLVKKDFFCLSYNNSKGTPNWVSWQVAPKFLGDKPRKRKFDTDTTLPPDFKRITHDDYTGSGFDRGHMCPHSDRAHTKEMSFATFVMTNIIPQSNENNSGAWNQLELYCRFLVEKKGKKLYVIAGPQGIRGEGRNGHKSKIADGAVTVPNKVWKVIMVLDRETDDNDLPRVNDETRLIAVIMPNDRTVSKDNWAQYRVSVKDVEELTGYKFFDRVPANMIDPLKGVVDSEDIPVLPRNH